MDMDRRQFVGSMLAGAGLALGTRPGAAAAGRWPVTAPTQAVTLGRSGVRASFVGMGTGVSGTMRSSNATRMGLAAFEPIVRHAVDRGITFFDVADSYGTHPLMKPILRGIPRETLTLESKIWFGPGGLPEPTTDAKAAVDRFLLELGVDYLDSVLLHCTTAPGWPQDQRTMMDDLSECKAAGKVRAVGTSCHSRAAMDANLATDWSDVQLARINHTGTRMDGPPAEIAELLRRMRAAGKGVIGMKIYGEGSFRELAQREASLRFVLSERCVDSIVIGFESPQHIDETLDTIERILAT